MNREGALQELLISLFDVDELHAYVRRLPDGEKLATSLPQGAISSDKYAWAVIDTLKRRGLIDGDFFARLVEDRPNRKQDILVVRVYWMGDARRESRLDERNGPPTSPISAGAHVRPPAVHREEKPSSTAPATAHTPSADSAAPERSFRLFDWALTLAAAGVCGFLIFANRCTQKTAEDPGEVSAPTQPPRESTAMTPTRSEEVNPGPLAREPEPEHAAERVITVGPEHGEHLEGGDSAGRAADATASTTEAPHPGSTLEVRAPVDQPGVPRAGAKKGSRRDTSPRPEPESTPTPPAPPIKVDPAAQRATITTRLERFIRESARECRRSMGSPGSDDAEAFDDAVDVNVILKTDGHVSNVKVLGSDEGTSFGGCMEEKIKLGKFDPFEGENLTMSRRIKY